MQMQQPKLGIVTASWEDKRGNRGKISADWANMWTLTDTCEIVVQQTHLRLKQLLAALLDAVACLAQPLCRLQHAFPLPRGGLVVVIPQAQLCSGCRPSCAITTRIRNK